MTELTRALDAIAGMEVASFKRPPAAPDRPGYYWVALDDGARFNPNDWLGAGHDVLGHHDGPFLVRLECVDGDWRAVMCDHAQGSIDFPFGVSDRRVRVSWLTSFYGMPGSCAQELRITWLLRLEPPPLPKTVG